MNFAKTLAADGTYDFPGNLHALSLLVIENSGANNAYFGCPPPVTLTRYGTTYEESPGVYASYIDLTLEGVSTPAISAESLAIRPGMIVADAGDTNLTVGTTVLYAIGNRVYLDQDAIGGQAGLTFTFTPPDLDDTTGITIAPGEKVWLTAAQHARFLQQGFRCYSTDGTTLKFMPKYN